MKTCVYIDGFNLYNGAIRKNGLHWLDLAEFCRRLNGGTPVERIIYCTTMVSATPSDPLKPHRQDAYLRAIRAVTPNLEVLLGSFQTQAKFMPLQICEADTRCAVKVSSRTEKGSDVNLATRLVHDAHLNRFDRAILVSGDSDLVEPVRLVVTEVNKEVVVRNPRQVQSRELSSVASGYDTIKKSVLEHSQLTDPVIAGTKTYYKPEKWKIASVPTDRKTIITTQCPDQNCCKFLKTCRWE